MQRTSTTLALILLICMLGCAWGQHGYTDFGEFWADTARLNVRYTISFDDLAAGGNASLRGITEIGADGLLSDGTSLERLTPIACNAFLPYSAPNALGAAGDNQFLAGNSDRVTFNFSRPVLAFGLFLIGNPSPTGDPPIPFWRMRINLPAPEVFSATEPLSSLGPGDDVYFLGIVSEEPFTEAQLFSDNDPAAVFSFGIDDVTWCTQATEASLSEAKSLPLGMEIVLNGAVVTRVHSDRFNVETSDRSSGIAVCGTGGIRNRQISLLGTLALTPDNERVVSLVQIIEQTATTGLSPLGMTTRAVGGGATSGLQIGCVGGVGLNNIGLDVSITGVVTEVGPDLSWIMVDDGCKRESGFGPTGVRVVGAIGERRQGEYVKVTGSSSIFAASTGYYPLIRVAHGKDIVPVVER